MVTEGGCSLTHDCAERVPLAGGHPIVYLHTGGIITCGICAESTCSVMWRAINYGCAVKSGAGGSMFLSPWGPSRSRCLYGFESGISVK